MRCTDLVVHYGDSVAVDHLNFEARRGEVLALLGPNGAGKTTTVETMEGYRKADGGSVQVLDLDPRRDHAALAPMIGVMLQKGGLYPSMGAAQALALFSRYYDHPRDTNSLLDLVGLREVRRTPWHRLSGGEQQRLALALALVGRPQVLFLDEPTAGVDPEGRIAVRDIIASERDGGTCVVLTTHELAEAERLADRVVIIDRGRALAEGSPAELASATADGSIRFTTRPGIDTQALELAVGDGARVIENESGSYRLVPPLGSGTPMVVAALAEWLAGRDLSLGDLRTGSSLEDAYLAITGSRGAPGPVNAQPVDAQPVDAQTADQTVDQPAGRSQRRRGRR